MDRFTKFKLDDQHNPVPCSLMDWGAMMANDAGRRVGFTKLPSGVEVSTVFLGLDHSWGEGPMLLFETMTFKNRHGTMQDRYSTWDEAVAGHERVVAELSSGEAHK